MRLGVHYKTVQRYRDMPEFLEWSRTHDPNEIGWVWHPDIKRFVPE